MNSSMTVKAQNAAKRFCLPGDILSVTPFGNGHINNTFRVIAATGDAGESQPFVLQRISPEAFPYPEQVMENISGVTRHLRKAIVEKGGDPDRDTMTLIPAKDGKDYFTDSDGGVWRIYTLIENTVSYDLPDTEELFKEAAVAFGAFQMSLDGYPAHTLHEVIPGFHDTPNRLNQLEAAVKKDQAGRLASVMEEVGFCRARTAKAGTLTGLLKEGKLPLRVTHNDTKLNNVLFDETTNRSVCVVDLDTVMPGLCAYDFGDAIRFGANTALEDEQDLTQVQFNIKMFEAYAEGYLAKAGSILTELEKATLPLGAWMMTLECGSRFLTDYLNGDTYFRTAYPTHNLVRARNQFKLLTEMEGQAAAMDAVIANVEKKETGK